MAIYERLTKAKHRAKASPRLVSSPVLFFESRGKSEEWKRVYCAKFKMAESIAVQACKKRVDEAVTTMVNQLDQETFRSMQKEMYLKSAKCCENTNTSMSEVQHCIEKCSQPLQAAQNYMQSELNDFLDRLQRCGMQCQDNIKDRLDPSASQAQIEKLKTEMENCIIQCGEKHIGLLGPMKQRIKSNLAKYH